jgi:hypothetical protein
MLLDNRIMAIREEPMSSVGYYQFDSASRGGVRLALFREFILREQLIHPLKTLLFSLCHKS